MEVAEDNACNISARDICNAEISFSDIGHEKAVAEGCDRNSSRVFISGIEPFENLVNNEAGNDRDSEEQDGLEHRAPYGSACSFGA